MLCRKDFLIVGTKCSSSFSLKITLFLDAVNSFSSDSGKSNWVFEVFFFKIVNFLGSDTFFIKDCYLMVRVSLKLGAGYLIGSSNEEKSCNCLLKSGVLRPPKSSFTSGESSIKDSR
jgi:hypothetical protein